MTEKDAWEEIWDARMRGLEASFGKSGDSVFHGTVPFEFGLEIGGCPDVVTFSDFTNGTLYVTAELVGCADQKKNSQGNYELAVAHQGDEDWGVNIICRLAYYALDNVLENGETMDIAEATPADSTIAGLLFKRIASFQFQGSPANVICCIGITKPELELCLDKGSGALLRQLPPDYVLTEMNRKSFV